MEKPFGTDLESAKELNATLHEVVGEDQVFRIDHFLGKEAAQNILVAALRQRAVRAGLEPRAHRLRADRRARGPDHRGPGRLLRVDRRVPGHDLHPPVPAPGLRGARAAGRTWTPTRSTRRRRRCSTRCSRWTRTTWCSASTRATARRRTWPTTRKWRRSWRWRCGATPGAGKGVPFFLRTGKAMAASGADDHDRLPRAAAAHVRPRRHGRVPTSWSSS